MTTLDTRVRDTKVERRPSAGQRRALGAYGEALAARYLVGLGMTVLERNWRHGRGEIDLVVLDGRCAVVCEVKARTGIRFGEPVEAVSWDKHARLRHLAAQWAATASIRPRELRIDVVGVLVPPAGPVVVRHIRGIGG